MLHAPSFYDGVLAAISRGGDTDTNGAIVAAILGFFFSKIIFDWFQKFEYFPCSAFFFKGIAYILMPSFFFFHWKKHCFKIYF